jgi:hypothetical protein
MDNETLTTIYAISQILDQLPKEKTTLKLNGVTLGKTIKRYPIKSKTQTLTQQEITMFTRQLMNAYKTWVESGHKEWIAKEIGGIRFTVMFTRKGFENHSKSLEEIYNKTTGGL